MTLIIARSSAPGNTTAINLGTTDSLLVRRMVEVLTENVAGTSSAVIARGSNQVIVVEGSIESSSGNAILVGDNIADTGTRIHIREGGSLAAGDDAIEFTGGGLRLINDGIIGGVYGIYCDSGGGALRATQATSFVNNGLIMTESNAFFLGLQNNGGYTLRNTGEIMSLNGSSYSSSGVNTVDRVYNTGSMTGEVILGDGNDLYSGATGQLLGGEIIGGEGNDTLISGADADTLIGGAGNDVLTGNAGADQFLFNAALNGTTNVDRITALAGVDSLVLLADAFPAIGAALTAAEFRVIATGTSFASVDATDRIIYLRSTGDLYYDADGNDSGARVRFADLAANTVVTLAQFDVL